MTATMTTNTHKGNMDWLLFFSIVVMVCFGLVMVYSSSSMAAELRFNEYSYYFLLRQAVAASAAFLLLVFLSQRDYRKLRQAHYAFAGVGIIIVLLIAVYFLDQRAHRWIRLGITNVQPSEFAKPALIVFLSWFVTLRSSVINSPHTVWPAALCLLGLAGGVVVADLGTATVLVATTAAMFYLAGLNRRYTAIAVTASVIFLTLAVMYKPYRLKRMIDFIDPGYKVLVYADPGKKMLTYANSGSSVQDTGYHVIQSKMAIGSGGLTGAGLMMSKQKLLYLPEAHTDFIYAIIAEETGLWGASLLLAGFVIILWRGCRLYWTASDDFGRYLAVGVTTSIVFQALLNMSVVLDLGPTKGIPLPLISYGGSSLVSSAISLGLLLSVSERAA
ncbi:MAG: cell division protein FtsW [Acidobacteriia bacterium]|nr:cell division protein FtsW [Terriglobia bacterium]